MEFTTVEIREGTLNRREKRGGGVASRGSIHICYSGARAFEVWYESSLLDSLMESLKGVWGLRKGKWSVKVCLCGKNEDVYDKKVLQSNLQSHNSKELPSTPVHFFIGHKGWRGTAFFFFFLFFLAGTCFWTMSLWPVMMGGEDSFRT